MPAADRAQARLALRARRQARAPTVRQRDDRTIFARVSLLITGLALSAPIVGVYWPMAGEPDPRADLPDWHGAGWRLALPCVEAVQAPLRLCAYAPGDPLVEGLLGTRQPALCAPQTPDVLVIPCLGFDARGYRLGYGGGFYDRTLAALASAGRHPMTIGVASDDAQMSGFENQPHDWPLDWVVTESRCLAGERPRP